MGGWRAYGIDPGEFSLHLMRTCERLVQIGHFKPNNPSELIAKSYYELLQHKKAILGKISLHSNSSLLLRTESVKVVLRKTQEPEKPKRILAGKINERIKKKERANNSHYVPKFGITGRCVINLSGRFITQFVFVAGPQGILDSLEKWAI